MIVTRDSEWDDEQVALLVAATELEHAIGPHGQPMSEAMSPLADRAGRLPGGWRYLPHVRVDHAARAISDAQNDRQKRYPDADTSAEVWTVEKVWND